MPRKEINPVVIGQRFDRLIVKEIGRFCYCICDCGNEKKVRRDHLKSGATKSCGCMHSELSSKRTKNLHKFNTKHNLCGTTIHNVWCGIKQRCNNPNNTFYHYYGGRGIEVCDEWINDFQNFLDDMGIPEEGMTLDRIDNNLGYFKENCRWATRKQQACNTRQNKLITYKDETLNITQWAKKLGVPRNTFDERLRRGWSVDEAIETPFIKRRKR